MAHLSFVHTTMKRFDEDQARTHGLPACPVSIMSIRGRKTLIISAASDYRAAAQRILPPFCSTIWMGVHILNTRCAATWKFVRSGAAPAYSEKHVRLKPETTLFNEKLSMPVALGPVGLVACMRDAAKFRQPKRRMRMASVYSLDGFRLPD